MSRRLRCGLVGAGRWASDTHAPALALHPDVEFVGIWGRDPEEVSLLAARSGTRAFPSLGSLFDEVEAVALAVAPEAQAHLAMRAVTSGLHVMLEKPIALTSADADALRLAVEQAGVASVVCFTGRWIPELSNWLADLEAQGGWECGRGELLSSAMVTESGFENSVWRQSGGALWDLGPHGLATLQAVLGDVVAVSAQTGPRDLVHMVMRHTSEASSTLLCSMTMPETVKSRHAYTFHGTNGSASTPALSPGTDHVAAAYGRALTALVRQALAGSRDEPCDVSLGAHAVDVLGAAQRSITMSCTQAVPARASGQATGPLRVLPAEPGGTALQDMQQQKLKKERHDRYGPD